MKTSYENRNNCLLREDQQLNSVPDSFLVAAICRDEPDEEALEIIVDRHLAALYKHCQVITQDQQRARDLAQEAWCRLLKRRCALRPDGNFRGYLLTIASNLQRDRFRLYRRNPISEDRLISLNSELMSDSGEIYEFGEMVPDMRGTPVSERVPLQMDVQCALNLLPERLRKVVVARYFEGEPSAQIGKRYQRTEQTICGWIREGIQLMRKHLKERPVGLKAIKQEMFTGGPAPHTKRPRNSKNSDSKL